MGSLREPLSGVLAGGHGLLRIRPRVRGPVRINEPFIGESRPLSDKMRNGPLKGDGGQNFGSGVWDATSSSASSLVSTEGGDPSRGLFAVSFMQATAITPTTAAPIA